MTIVTTIMLGTITNRDTPWLMTSVSIRNIDPNTRETIPPKPKIPKLDTKTSATSRPIPVIVWVAPGGAHAGSAGVLITLAGHIAAMAPGSNIGAAHPVSGGGKDIEGDMAEKVTNDAAAFAESIAETRGRNKKWAINAVRQSVSITAKRAKEINVVDHLAVTLDELLEKIDGTKIELKKGSVVLKTKGAVVETLEMNLKQKIVTLLGDPNIMYILMMIAALGIYFELSNPGLIVPGVLGAIAIILSFISAQALPINYGAILLLLLGIGLLVAEVFVSSFGILGFGGIVSLVLGSIFLIDTDVMSHGVSLLVIVPSIIVVTIVMLGVGYAVLRTHRKRASTGKESLVGMSGKVREEILAGKEGKVFVHGELWSAISEEIISKDETIEVTEVNGLTLKVTKKKEN